ncbi:hypothetical protein [Nannocystis punicea]|uniref:Uncharacterized protein n=1 Tax=Nannocystis punicea TaxID=2995304 RepID=A0ABY7GT47_9BACT|nr:hypothetical protein [Nannocystis poenicansa]WAS90135.1 hypothetical protein O0S08_28405 [Nannocystis poenicansa]
MTTLAPAGDDCRGQDSRLLALAALVFARLSFAAPPVDLTWQAPRECPTAVVVTDMVAGLLRQPAGDLGPGRAVARATVTRGAAGWELRLELHGRGGDYRRTVRAETCQLLARATALLIAIHLDPLAVTRGLPATVAPAPPDLSSRTSTFLPPRTAPPADLSPKTSPASPPDPSPRPTPPVLPPDSPGHPWPSPDLSPQTAGASSSDMSPRTGAASSSDLSSQTARGSPSDLSSQTAAAVPAPPDLTAASAAIVPAPSDLSAWTDPPSPALAAPLQPIGPASPQVPEDMSEETAYLEAAPSPRPATRPPVLGHLRLEGGLDVGVLPAAGALAGVFGGVTWPRLRLEVGLVGAPLRVRSVQGDRPGGRFDRLAAVVRICPTWHPRPLLAVHLCAGGEVGALRGVGLGVDVPRPQWAPWASLFLGPALRWRVTGVVGLWLGVEALVALNRPIFTVQAGEEEVFRGGRAGVRASFGLDLQFGARNR